MAQNIESYCNLLRWEISAVETYRQALAEFPHQPEATVLARIAEDHEHAVVALQSRIEALGFECDDCPPVWENPSQVSGLKPRVFSESPVIHMLIEGEQKGINEYKAALETDLIEEDFKITIRKDLIPGIDGHLETLGELCE